MEMGNAGMHPIRAILVHYTELRATHKVALFLCPLVG
jgi:hypothetical protein